MPNIYTHVPLNICHRNNCIDLSQYADRSIHNGEVVRCSHNVIWFNREYSSKWDEPSTRLKPWIKLNPYIHWIRYPKAKKLLDSILPKPSRK